MEPTSLCFWGVMSLATLAGALFAYPVNVWLVARGLKHGMGTVEVLGRGGHTLEVEHARAAGGAATTHRSGSPRERQREHRVVVPRGGETALVTLATLVALVAGIWIGVRFGGL